MLELMYIYSVCIIVPSIDFIIIIHHHYHSHTEIYDPEYVKIYNIYNVNEGLINHPRLDCTFLPEARFFVFVQISPLLNKGMQQIPPQLVIEPPILELASHNSFSCWVGGTSCPFVRRPRCLFIWGDWSLQNLFKTFWTFWCWGAEGGLLTRGCYYIYILICKQILAV